MKEVNSKERAWKEVNKIFPTDYEKDEEASQRSGYDVYRHPTLNYYNRICDLGNRLEVIIGEYGESVTNIWIVEPEIADNCGTKMKQSDYEKLVGQSHEWELTDEEAKVLVSDEFGFETSRIKIIKEVKTYTKVGCYLKPYQTFERTPQNCSTDYNYVRFDVNSWQYEMINGQLYHYYS